MSTAKRIQREAEQLAKQPCREFLAYPSEDNPFQWFFTMRGPDDSPYAEGVYHGKIVLPQNYPMAPPDIMLLTPNGRFELDKKICLTDVTSYHPENWQPSWGIHMVVLALRDHMTTPGSNALGSIEYPAEKRRQLAAESRTWVSPQGVSMQEHLARLDSCPPWAERRGPAGSTPASTPVSTPASAALDAAGAAPPAAATPPQAAAAGPAAVPGAPVVVGGRAAPQGAAAVPPPELGSPAQPPQPPAQPPQPPAQPPQAQEQQLQGLQVSEATLNNAIGFLMAMILAILAKKWLWALDLATLQS